MSAASAWETLFAHASEALYQLSPQGIIVEANLVGCAQLGFTRQELIGCTLDKFDPEFRPERWQGFWDDLVVRRSVTFPRRHLRADGSRFPVEVRINLLPDDLGAVVVVHDRSESVAREAAL